MGELIQFETASRQRRLRPPGWRLATRLVAKDAPRPKRAVLYMDDVAIVCAVEGTPLVGDRVQGHLPAVVARVLLTRDGELRIYAHRERSLPREPPPRNLAHNRLTQNGLTQSSTGGVSTPVPAERGLGAGLA